LLTIAATAAVVPTATDEGGGALNVTEIGAAGPELQPANPATAASADETAK
jgi:hypothetical protein